MSLGLAGAVAVAVGVAAVVLAVTLRGISYPARLIGHPDAGALRDAGLEIGIRRWEGLRLVIAAGALALVIVSGLPPAVVALGALAPSIWIRLRAEAARDRARRAVTRMVLGTEAALRSGAALPEALRRGAAATGDPLAERPIRTALRAFDLGASIDDALREAAVTERDPRAALALETLALGIGERLPRERLADLVASVADRLLFDERLDGEVRARASGVRMQQRLVAVLVPAIALYLVMTMPTLAAVLDGPIGRSLLVPGAAALEVAGFVAARRIIRGAIR